MKHIIYVVLLSVGCIMLQSEAVWAGNVESNNPPECMSVGTNFWFLASWSSSNPFNGSMTPSAWSTAYNFADPENSANVWDADFLDAIDIYSTLRFMDWGDTNNSLERVWSDRQQPNSDHTPPNSGWGRVAYEWMIDLCNKTQKDMWICIPHRADDTYVTNLATLIRDDLDPNLRVYLEYSNEIWHFSGRWTDAQGRPREGQGTYVQEDIGQAIINSSLLVNLPNHTDPNKLRMYAQSYRSVQIWELWENVFGSQFSTRVRKIIAGKSRGPSLGQDILDGLNDNLLNPNSTMPDAYAIAPYFGKGPWDQPDSHVLMEDLDDQINTEVLPYVQQNYTIWTEGAGINLVAYEGGIHTDNRTNNLELNRDEGIKNVYKYYLDRMSEYLPLFNHYVHDGVFDEGNTWGSIELSFPDLQPINDHKYRAISEWIDENDADNCNPDTGTIDTISGNGDCPSDLTVSDYQGADAQLQAANTLTCSADIASGVNVECKAGTLVRLTDGFHAQVGSNFHAFIDGCEEDPPGGSGACQVLINHDFETGVNNWFIDNCTASSSGGIANITNIIPNASEPWNAVFRQEGVALQQDKTYTLSMKAKASAGRDVILKVFKDAPYTSYNEHQITLTTSMQTFTFPSFMMNTAEVVKVELIVGQTADDIQIDYISLTEDCGQCQLLSNTGFDSEFDPWSKWECEFVLENGAVKFTDIGVDVNNNTMSGFSQSGLELVQGNTYTLTFDAKANNARPIAARIHNGPTASFTLSDVMVKYTLPPFLATNNESNGKVEFFLGDNGAWVHFDNIELKTTCTGSSKEDNSLTPDINLYPNPATNTIHVEYELPQSTSANITVFDAFGKMVKNISNVALPAGQQTLNMDTADLATGMYFYTIQTGAWKVTKKFVIAK